MNSLVFQGCPLVVHASPADAGDPTGAKRWDLLGPRLHQGGQVRKLAPGRKGLESVQVRQYNIMGPCGLPPIRKGAGSIISHAIA